MSDRYVLHVVPHGERWAVKERGVDEPRTITATKEEAIAAAKTRARKRPPSQVLVHGRDGRIQDEFTYGDDPYPPAG